MTPNQVTLTRVAAAFAAVALFTLFGNSLAADLAAVILTVAAIALDGLDGYLARTRDLATPLGAQLDILGDRVVENLFFTFFAVSGLISLWVPGPLLRARHAHRFPPLTSRPRRPQRLQHKFDARNLVGTHARCLAGQPRRLCRTQMRLLLLSRPAATGRAHHRSMAQRARAPCARGSRPIPRRCHSRLLRPPRDPGNLGRPPLSRRHTAENSRTRCRTGHAMTAPQQNIGAFFDLDGTLLPAPSLEWRFIGYLLERNEISSAQVTAWLAHFAASILRNPQEAIAGNKYYLAGINTSLASDWENSLPPISANEDSLPLFARGLKQIAWHHAQAHQIFLITGTLAPLAQILAKRIAAQTPSPNRNPSHTAGSQPSRVAQPLLAVLFRGMDRPPSNPAHEQRSQIRRAGSRSHNPQYQPRPKLRVWRYFRRHPDAGSGRATASSQSIESPRANRKKTPLANPQLASIHTRTNPKPRQDAIRRKALPMTHASQTIWSVTASRRFAKQEFANECRRSAPHSPLCDIKSAKKNART